MKNNLIVALRRARCIAALLPLALLTACGGGGASVDEEGNVVVAATFSKSFGGDKYDQGVFATETARGDYFFAGTYAHAPGDGVIGRLDVDGNLLWNVAFGIQSVGALAKGTSEVGIAEADFCIAGSVYGSEGRTRGTLTRVSDVGAILWETEVPGGDWAGYEYIESGDAATGTDDAPIAAIGDGNGGCYGLFTSTADLFDASGNGFDGEEARRVLRRNGSVQNARVFSDATSYVLARVDSTGALLWWRRITNGAFRNTPYGRFTGGLSLTAQGVLVDYPVARSVGTLRPADYRVLAHFDRLGGADFISQIEFVSVAGSQALDAAAAAQTDDPQNGARDGVRDDGFVYADDQGLVKVDRRGFVEWQQPAVATAPRGLTQWCSSSACFVLVAGTEPGTESRAAVGGIRVFDLTTGQPVRVLPDSDVRRVLDFATINSNSFRILAQDTESNVSVRYYSIDADSNSLPDVALIRSVPLVSATEIASDGRLLSLRFRNGGAFGFSRSGIMLVPEGAQRRLIGVTAREPIEFVTAATTTSTNAYVVAAATLTEPSGSVLLSFDAQGNLRWQRRIAGERIVEQLLSGRQGGVIALLRGFGSLGGRVAGENLRPAVGSTVVAISGQGELLWQSPNIMPMLSAEQFPAQLAAEGPSFVSLALGDALRSPVPGAVYERQPGLLLETSSGYLVTGPLRFGSDEDRAGIINGSWVAKVASDSSIEWLRGYSFYPTSGHVAADGSVVLSQGTGDGFAIFALDNDGNVRTASKYALLRGTKTEGAYVSGSDNGALNVTLTTAGLYSPERVYSANGPATTAVNDTNVSVARISASGDVEWVRVHGALRGDRALGATGMSDGGVMVSGASESLGESDEIWLLRLGRDGKVSDSCNAYLAEIPGSFVERSAIEAVAVDLPVPTDRLQQELAAGDFQIFPAELVEARQCLGSSSPDNGPVDGPGFLTLQVNQAGSIDGLISSVPNGIFCGGNATEVCEASYAPDTIVTLTVDDSSAATFRGWGDGCLETRVNPQRCLVELVADKTIDAFFESADGTRATLTAEVIGDGRIFSTDIAGIDCRRDATTSDCSEAFLLGQRVRLEMDRPAGVDFLGWENDCAGWAGSQSIRIELDRDKTCTARFSGAPDPLRYPLQVAVEVDGQPARVGAPGGLVDSVPGGIQCSLPGSDCVEEFIAGTGVRLRATAVPGYEFVDWTSSDPASPCYFDPGFITTVVMSEPRDCTARFRNANLTTFTLSTSVLENLRVPVPGGPSGGRITSSPPGIDCGPAGSDCSQSYLAGTQIVLTATPEPGFNFVGWAGGGGTLDCAPGVGPVATVTLGGNFECQALFNTNPGGGGTNDVTVRFDAPATGARVVAVGNGALDCRSECTVALPVASSPVELRPINEGATWINWYGCDAIVPDPANAGGPALCRIDISGGARAVTVEFGL